MPEQAFDEEYTNGVVTKRTPRTVSDAEIHRRDAPTRLRTFYPVARQWAQDAAQTNTNWPTMTAGQKDAAMRETIRRLGLFFDGMGDLLLERGLDS